MLKGKFQWYNTTFNKMHYHFRGRIMAAQVIGLDKSSDCERGTSFLDFKLKRRRLSEIVSTGVASQLDSDNQSTISSESGYGSQIDRNSAGKCSPKELFEDGSENENQESKSNLKNDNENGAGPQINNLFIPPPYYCDKSNLHIGVAYVSFESDPSNLNGKSDELKVGFIPVMDSVLPFSVKGLASINSQHFPKGTQPLFMTTMPTGFFMTNTGPTAVTAGQEIKVSDSAIQTNKANKEEPVYPKSCATKKVMTKDSETEFIDHYTNGMFEYLGHLGGSKGKESKKSEQPTSTTSSTQDNAKYDNKYPMVCGICNDKATGLHYGIITCEG